MSYTSAYNDVRTVKGVPKISDFASKQGTPLVIDEVTGFGYFGSGKDVIGLKVDPASISVALAQAGMRIVTSVPITLGAGWTRIDGYDGLSTTPLGVVPDTGEGSLLPNYLSPMQVIITISMLFDEAQNGRLFWVRVFDVAYNVELGRVPVPVGRNTAGQLVSMPILTQGQHRDSRYVLELGGGDTFVNTALQFVNFGLVITMGVGFEPSTNRDGFDDGFDDGYE